MGLKLGRGDRAGQWTGFRSILAPIFPLFLGLFPPFNIGVPTHLSSVLRASQCLAQRCISKALRKGQLPRIWHWAYPTSFGGAAGRKTTMFPQSWSSATARDTHDANADYITGQAPSLLRSASMGSRWLCRSRCGTRLPGPGCRVQPWNEWAHSISTPQAPAPLSLFAQMRQVWELVPIPPANLLGPDSAYTLHLGSGKLSTSFFCYTPAPPQLGLCP